MRLRKPATPQVELVVLPSAGRLEAHTFASGQVHLKSYLRSCMIFCANFVNRRTTRSHDQARAMTVGHLGDLLRKYLDGAAWRRYAAEIFRCDLITMPEDHTGRRPCARPFRRRSGEGTRSVMAVLPVFGQILLGL